MKHKHNKNVDINPKDKVVQLKPEMYINGKHKYFEVIEAFANDKIIQVKSKFSNNWIDYISWDFPNFNDCALDFRIKPIRVTNDFDSRDKIVDMKHKYYNVIKAFAKGNKIQFSYADTDWIDFHSAVFPDFNNKGIKWRIKPEYQKLLNTDSL
jgi:hypothetical protein